MHNILEARIEYKEGKLCQVTVLVEISPGDIRAIFATDSFRDGYESIKPGEPLSDDLLQRVAGYGMETVDRDRIFPGWRAYHGFKSKKGL